MIETALAYTISLSRKIILQLQHENLLTEEHIDLRTRHWRADEIRNKRDILHIRLDARDEFLPPVPFHARRSDEYRLHASVAHDALGICHAPEEQEPPPTFAEIGASSMSPMM